MRINFRVLEGYKRRALYTFVWGFAAMLLIGLAADLTQRPYIFPSLGPSAIMVFGHPLRRDSSPRHAILGHAVGALAGYFALAARKPSTRPPERRRSSSRSAFCRIR